jgi:hypothetical protein
MKNSFFYILFFSLIIAGSSCKKDNYDAPTTTLSGKLTYKGESIGVEQYQVPYELYQFGFGKVGAIGSSFAQDGSFSALLFDGDYKLIVPNGQGPFRWKYLASGAPDSVAITLRGNQAVDLEVTPYYMIRTPQIAAAGGKVTATFKAEKIITDVNAKDIERVNLYVNKTQFVSGNNDQNIANVSIAGTAIVNPNTITISVTVPTISPVQNYVFARIGLKVAGVEDLIFSPVTKVTY